MGCCTCEETAPGETRKRHPEREQEGRNHGAERVTQREKELGKPQAREKPERQSRGEEGAEEGRGNHPWEQPRETELGGLPLSPSLVHPSRASLAPEHGESFASSPLALGEPNSVLFTRSPGQG